MAAVVDVQTFLRSADGTFVLVESCDERPVDSEYIEGAIELTVHGTAVVTVAEWDYVDQLWSYIADMTEAFLAAGEASTYFPDQPVLLTFSRTSPKALLVSCKTGNEIRRANVAEDDFLKAIRIAGGAFFRKMTTLVPENSGAYRTASRSLGA